jgi:glyoxylase-like metal-dependent hydrolase (beta-lactamase superfamily II)
MGPQLARPLGELFGGPDHPVWALAETPDPTGEWVLHFHCYLLRDPRGRTVLVDTGLGAADSPAATLAPVPGRLTAELAAAGVTAEEIDAVVLTHLHSDHVSGSIAGDGSTPAFPNARYLVQHAELRCLPEDPEHPVRQRIVDPLRAAGSLNVVDGDYPMMPGIAIMATPGHTPGHQSVAVGDGELIVSGDVIHHSVQLTDPTAAYLYDDDQETATATRISLTTRLRARNGTLATAHLAEPFTVLRGTSP